MSGENGMPACAAKDETVKVLILSARLFCLLSLASFYPAAYAAPNGPEGLEPESPAPGMAGHALAPRSFAQSQTLRVHFIDIGWGEPSCSRQSFNREGQGHVMAALVRDAKEPHREK